MLVDDVDAMFMLYTYCLDFQYIYMILYESLIFVIPFKLIHKKAEGQRRINL